MTPKERAKQIHLSMCYAIKTEETEGGFYSNTIHAKNAALVVVDTVLNLCWGNNQVGVKHWQEVKNEIEKI
jgi:hypothetical protein